MNRIHRFLEKPEFFRFKYYFFSLIIWVIFIAGSSCKTQDLRKVDAKTFKSGVNEGNFYFESFEGSPKGQDSLALKPLVKQIKKKGPYQLPNINYQRDDLGIFSLKKLPYPFLPENGHSFIKKGAELLWKRFQDGGLKNHLYMLIRDNGLFAIGSTNGPHRKREFDPSIHMFAFPLQVGATWGYQRSRRDSIHFKVIGIDTLVRPKAENIPTFVLQKNRIRTDKNPPEITRRTISFYSRKLLYPLATIELNVQRVTYFNYNPIQIPKIPQGYASYCTLLDNQPVAFPRPEDWSFINFDDITRSRVKSVILIKDKKAEETLFGDNYSFSNDDSLRLVTPNNVNISLSVIPVDKQPESFLEEITQDIPLEGKTTTQPLKKTSINGNSGYKMQLTGKDQDGMKVKYRQIAFNKGGKLYYLTILKPKDHSSNTNKTIKTILENLVIGTS